MKRNAYLNLAAMAILAIGLLASAGCKSSGMAMTSSGQIFKINILHPTDLPENGQDNLDVVLSSRGRDVKDVLLDVDLPPQLIVMDETHDRGVTMTHDAGTNTYHFTFGNLQFGEDSKVRFKVRTQFGNLSETGKVTATAWQRNLPGDKLIETAVIKLRP